MLVLRVLVRVGVNDPAGMLMLVLVLDVLVRMLVARPVRVAVFMGVFGRTHAFLYSLYTN